MINKLNAKTYYFVVNHRRNTRKIKRRNTYSEKSLDSPPITSETLSTTYKVTFKMFIFAHSYRISQVY